jgi:hypothetical protein
MSAPKNYEPAGQHEKRYQISSSVGDERISSPNGKGDAGKEQADWN